MDRALLSSVSAKVMRRRGVSNDLRDRGDEWPLRNVVKGLSVVVATVVEEVSMVFGSAAAPLRLATLCSQLKRGRYGLAAAQTRYAPSQRCARLQSGLQSKFAPAMRPQNTFFDPTADFEKTRQPPPTNVAKNLCARSPISHEAGKDGMMVLCLASVRLAISLACFAGLLLSTFHTPRRTARTG